MEDNQRKAVMSYPAGRGGGAGGGCAASFSTHPRWKDRWGGYRRQKTN